MARTIPEEGPTVESSAASSAASSSARSAFAIAFGYRKQQGKDTCAEISKALLERHDIPVVIDSFGSPVHSGICRETFCIDDKWHMGHNKEAIISFWNMSAREMMQRGAEALKREFGQDLYVKSLFKRYSRHQETALLIPDLRFKRELEALQNFGAILVKVDRTPYTEDRHISEIDLQYFNGWHYHIDNSGAIANTQQQLATMLADIINKLGGRARVEEEDGLACLAF